MARNVMQMTNNNPSNRWTYVVTSSGHVQSVLLTTALFHHIYYSYVSCKRITQTSHAWIYFPEFQRYTFEFSTGIRTIVDEMTNCEDIFINAMVADDCGTHGIMADYWMGYSCGEECGRTPENSISMAKGHYAERTKCVNIIYNYYGYMPLQASTFYAVPLSNNLQLSTVEEKHQN